MIFYFTGTGNSLWVAKTLEKAFNEPLISIAESLQQENKEISFTLREDEKIFFVYPVHSWGPAVLVTKFISRLKLERYTNQPIYSICTCGDECGYTTDILQKHLNKKGLTLTASHSIQMPNNYILMKGFDVDTKEVENKKLQQAPETMDSIIHQIDKEIYHTGSKPFLKSRFVYPLFTTFAVGHNSFHAMKDICTSCGLCAHICPTGSITMEEGTPEWNNTCVQCTACIHRCPARAIEYGNETWKKGRYHHPDL